MNTNTFITTIGTEVTVDQKLQTKPRGWTKEVVIMGVVLDSEGHSYTSPSEADFYSVFLVMTNGFKFWLEDFFQEDVAFYLVGLYTCSWITIDALVSPALLAISTALDDDE